MGVGRLGPRCWRALATPVQGQDPTIGRWLDGLYLDEPVEEWDDPYRFFIW